LLAWGLAPGSAIAICPDAGHGAIGIRIGPAQAGQET